MDIVLPDSILRPLVLEVVMMMQGAFKITEETAVIFALVVQMPVNP